MTGATRLAMVCVLSIGTVAACGNTDDTDTDGESPAAIDARAAEVMPFDLEATTHTFDKTETGGVQTVTAHDQTDAEQVGLIHDHLVEEVAAFQKGDFDDPARIHGHDMPGLAELIANYDRIEIEYRSLDGGGQITYTATDPALVDALHAWFDRQTMDHG